MSLKVKQIAKDRPRKIIQKERPIAADQERGSETLRDFEKESGPTGMSVTITGKAGETTTCSKFGD